MGAAAGDLPDQPLNPRGVVCLPSICGGAFHRFSPALVQPLSLRIGGNVRNLRAYSRISDIAASGNRDNWQTRHWPLVEDAISGILPTSRPMFHDPRTAA